MSDTGNDLRSAIAAAAKALREPSPPKQGVLVVPRYVKEEMDDLSDLERAELDAMVSSIAHSFGLDGWRLEVADEVYEVDEVEVSPAVLEWATDQEPGAGEEGERTVYFNDDDAYKDGCVQLWSGNPDDRIDERKHVGFFATDFAGSEVRWDLSIEQARSLAAALLVVADEAEKRGDDDDDDDDVPGVAESGRGV